MPRRVCLCRQGHEQPHGRSVSCLDVRRRAPVVGGGDALADLIGTRMSSIPDSLAAGGRQGCGAGKGESEGKGKGGAGLRRAVKAQACCRRGKRREARRCRACGRHGRGVAAAPCDRGPARSGCSWAARGPVRLGRPPFAAELRRGVGRHGRPPTGATDPDSRSLTLPAHDPSTVNGTMRGRTVMPSNLRSPHAPPHAFPCH